MGAVLYVDDGDVAVFDGLSFRRDKKTGYYLNAKTHKRLHVYVWEHFNGEIPDGCEIHHRGADKRNNELSNLEMLTSEEHRKLHAKSLTEEQREWRRKNLAENALPKATEWHKSEVGAEWHKAHYEQMKDALYRKREFVCENCGKPFESPQVHAKYCCNNCKSAARRKSGVDDVLKTCEMCGGEYVANKYQKTKYCKGCKGRARRR